MGTHDEPPRVLPQEHLSDDFFTDAFETEGGGRADPVAAEKFFHEQIGDAPEPTGGGGLGSDEGDEPDQPEGGEAGAEPRTDQPAELESGAEPPTDQPLPEQAGMDGDPAPAFGPSAVQEEEMPQGVGDGPVPERPVPEPAGGPVETSPDDPPVTLSG